MQRIVDTGKTYLEVSDKCRDAAAYMISRFMTRPDVKKQQLPGFIDWILSKMQQVNGKLMMGIFSLTSLFVCDGCNLPSMEVAVCRHVFHIGLWLVCKQNAVFLSFLGKNNEIHKEYFGTVIENIIILDHLMAVTSSKRQKIYIFCKICDSFTLY